MSETTAEKYGTIQDRRPNFRDAAGYLYLVRCFACSPVRGTENYCLAVPHGICAWCGWKDDWIEELPEASE